MSVNSSAGTGNPGAGRSQLREDGASALRRAGSPSVAAKRNPGGTRSWLSGIDYYFTSISPFTYLGHKAITDVAERHGATIAFKPVNLGGVWAESGAVPMPQRTPMRQRYRLIELQRAAELRGLPITPKPAHFPVDPSLADHTVIAVFEIRGSSRRLHGPGARCDLGERQEHQRRRRAG